VFAGRHGASGVVALALLVFSAVADGAEGVRTVDECVRLALERSPAAQAAGFQVDAASAQLRAARSAYAPRLLVQGEYGRSERFDEAVTNGGSTAALLTIEAALLDGGLRDAQFAAARARLKGTEARARQQRADLALAVRAAYFTALARRSEAAVQADALRAVRAYAEMLRRQGRNGLVPRNDVLRAQLAVETAGAAGRAAAADLRTSCDLLGTLTGEPLPPEALIDPEHRPIVQADTNLIDASPVMVDVRSAAEAAQREIDAVSSERGEKLTLTASGGFLGVQPAPTFHDNGGGQFLVGFSLPIFDGGVVAQRIAAAVAAANAAKANVEQSRQTVATALFRASTEAELAQADVDAWREAVPKARESFELMRARYFGGGDVRLLEVLDALNQSVDARLNLQHALLSYRVAAATQLQILGEGLP